MSASYILVVDDEPDIRDLVKEILEDEGYSVATAENAAAAREARRAQRPDLILLDIWMPDTDGITLLKEWSEGDHLPCPVVMMSATGPSRLRWRRPGWAPTISSRSRCRWPNCC